MSMRFRLRFVVLCGMLLLGVPSLLWGQNPEIQALYQDKRIAGDYLCDDKGLLPPIKDHRSERVLRVNKAGSWKLVRAFARKGHMDCSMRAKYRMSTQVAQQTMYDSIVAQNVGLSESLRFEDDGTYALTQGNQGVTRGSYDLDQGGISILPPRASENDSALWVCYQNPRASQPSLVCGRWGDGVDSPKNADLIRVYRWQDAEETR